MYEKKTKQVSFDENPNSFIGAQLSSENRWVKLAQIIPWDLVEEKYAEAFTGKQTGNPSINQAISLMSKFSQQIKTYADIMTYSTPEDYNNSCLVLCLTP